MAKMYGDIPCVNMYGDIHITVSAKKCLCGQAWSYETPFLYAREGVKRSNIIWRRLETVTCRTCKELFIKKEKQNDEGD